VNSSVFGIYTAITPSGFSDPTTTVNTVSYVDEDDIVVIAWSYPVDDGGLTTSFIVEILSGTGAWITVN